jgi:hypothetical protein
MCFLLIGLAGCGVPCDERGVYVDADGDGYGDDARVGYGCADQITSVDPGFSLQGGDCDDADPGASPSASEVCDSIDNDCDELIDAEDDSVVDATVYYADTDGDGYGDPDAGLLSCAAQDGYVTDEADCDDTDASINPGAGWDGAGEADRNCSATLEDNPAVYGLDGERLGIDLTIGDFDGDGQGDLLAGAYLSGDTQQGRVYLIYGPLSGGLAAEEAAVVFEGPEGGAHAGIGVAHEPTPSRQRTQRWSDLDGDGAAELIFGANNQTTGSGSEAGTVSILFSGARHTSETASSELLTIEGNSYNGHLGRGLSFVGDIDGDGTFDLFVGAPDYRDDDNIAIGAGFLVSGSALIGAVTPSALSIGDVATPLWGHQAQSELGFQGALGADINADGSNDLITSAYLEGVSTRSATAQGSVYLLTGPVTAERHLSEQPVISGEEGYLSRFGVAMAADDLNGDGYDDVLSGAIGGGASAGGRLWVLPGDRTGSSWSAETIDELGTTSITSDELEAGFGSAVDTLDANGDEHPDIVVSAKYWGASSSAGAVFVFYGPLSGTMSTADAALFLPRSNAIDSLAGEMFAIGDDLLGTTGPIVAIAAPADAPDDGAVVGAGAIYLLDLGLR